MTITPKLKAPGAVAAQAIILFGASLYAMSLAVAADWSASPRLQLGGSYDDNYLMTSNGGQPVAVSGAELEGQLALSGSTPTSVMALTPRIHSSFYDKSIDNSTDYYLEGRLQHNGQRFLAGLNANYIKETTARSERPGIGDPNLQDPTGSDSGVIFQDVTRELIAIQPLLEADVSQRNKLALHTRYTDVNFNKTRPGLADFTSYGASLGWVYKLSQTSTFTVRTDASKYEPASSTAHNADSYGGELEWAREFSNIGSTYLRGGFRRTQRETLPTDLVKQDKVNSYVGGAGVKWAFEITDVLVDLTMSVDPNASGVLVKRDQLRMQLRHRFRPKLAGTFGARYIQDKSLVDTAITVEKRRYAIGTAEMEWRETRTVSLTAQYNYTNQKFRGTSERDAASNTVNLSVVYEPKRPD